MQIGLFPFGTIKADLLRAFARAGGCGNGGGEDSAIISSTDFRRRAFPVVAGFRGRTFLAVAGFGRRTFLTIAGFRR